jgi:hypothetical protein
MMTHNFIWDAVNRLDRRLSPRRSKATGRRRTVATARDERRRLITLGLMMRFASFAAQPSPRCGCRLKTEAHDLAAEAAWLAGYRSRNHPGRAVDLPHGLPEARGLGVPVRRRQFKDWQRLLCLCVFWRFAPAGDGTPRQSSPRPPSLISDGDGYRVHFPFS